MSAFHPTGFIHTVSRVLLPLVFCVVLSACGQTGPLKLPDEDKKEEAGQ